MLKAGAVRKLRERGEGLVYNVELTPNPTSVLGRKIDDFIAAEKGR
jgi:hypothetical protein